jgi:hypothetical protein
VPVGWYASRGGAPDIRSTLSTLLFLLSHLGEDSKPSKNFLIAAFYRPSDTSGAHLPKTLAASAPSGTRRSSNLL